MRKKENPLKKPLSLRIAHFFRVLPVGNVSMLSLDRSTFQYWGKRNGVLGGLEFITLETVPKNTQLCHWYGSGWWDAREVKRVDVGTKSYPAPKRARRKPSNTD